MLEKISKKDKLWRRFAFKICKNRMLSDDLVQEMYLVIYKYQINYDNKKIKDTYIYVILLSLFKKHLKQNNKELSLNSFINLQLNDEIFEPNDKELNILERYNNLDWKQKHLIELKYDMSLREIEKNFPMINYAYAYRQIKEAREIILKK